MPGLIQGLEVARRALLAHQAALNVTGNNVANVTTPGYTRQRAVMAPSPTERTPDGLLGTGVRMEGVQRLRDIFLDAQIRDEMGLAGQWATRSEILGRMEKVLNEPSETGLGALLDEFWNAWLDLSNHPEDSAARSVLVQKGESLATGFRQQDFRLRKIAESADIDLEQRVSGLNSLFGEVATLNAQISRAEVGGAVDCSLRDRRDLVVDQLAREGGTTSLTLSDGTVVLRLGGRTVVERDNVTPLITQKYGEDGRVRIRIIFSTDKTAPAALSGELGGLLEAREHLLPGFLEQMNSLAATLALQVNRLHQAGPSHLPFFRGDTAEFLQVNPEVSRDITQINAGSTGDPGDNDIALAVAALRDERVFARGTATISDFYRAALTDLGSYGQQANQMSESQEAAVGSLEAQRQSAVGVNMDEELTRMIATQKAYEAAARVFSTFTEMLDTLLEL